MADMQRSGVRMRREHAPRVPSLDYIRVTAASLVVLSHAIELNYSDLGDIPNEVEALIVYTCYALSRTAVPMFLMLTGYLLLSRDYSTHESVRHFWKKNFLPLLLTWELWVAIYYPISCWHYKTKFDVLELIWQLLLAHKCTLVHSWYIPMILGVYFFIPYIAKAVQSLDKTETSAILAVSLWSAFLLPSINNLFGGGLTFSQGVIPLIATPFSSTNFSGGPYGFYIFAGYLIRKHANTSADRHPLFISLGTFIISLAISALVVEAIPKIGFWYNNVCLVPTSASLFIFLHSLDFHSSVRRNEIFALLSKASFGIYLVHYPILLYLSTIFDRPAQSFRNLISLFALSLISSMFIVLATRHTPKIGRALFRM